MKKSLLVFTVLAFVSHSALAWGGLGHRLVAAIADSHLKPEVKERVDGYLGSTIVCEATWMDRTAFWTRKYKSHLPGWEQTSYWHTYAVNPDFTPSDKRAASGGGDMLPNLKQCVENLKNYRNLTDSAVVVNIKCVVHMIGDMHCPGHIYYTEFPDCFARPKNPATGEKGYRARDRQILYYNGKKMNYHSYWDGVALTDIFPEYKSNVEDYRMAFDRTTAGKRKKICKGTIEDWATDSAKASRPIYEWLKEGDYIDRNFVLEHKDLTKQQCVKAGCRLAHILNECFK